MSNHMESFEKAHKEKQAKKLLADTIKKAIMTTMIHSIAECENRLGHLWAIDEEDESKVTQAQLEIEDLFEEWRKSVLDRGNEQGRRLIALLDGYEIVLKTVKIPVQERNVGNG